MSASEQKAQQHADALEMLKDVISKAFEKGYEQAVAELQPAIAAFQQAVNRLSQLQKKPKRADSRSWPVLEGNNLTFKGNTVRIRGSKSIVLLKKLIDARGEAVDTDTLRASYPGSSDLNSAIKNLRKALGSKVPALRIELARGGGYRLVIKK